MSKSTTLPIDSNEDVVLVRQETRRWAARLQLSLVETTKLVTAASELARNTLEHGGGGEVELSEVEHQGRRGIRLVFTDEGPGIEDIGLAMQEGHTTGGGLGLGLPGSRRLVSEFKIDSTPGRGTRVEIVRWK